MAEEISRQTSQRSRSRSSQSSQNIPELLSLPDEILEQVYLFLSFNDRLNFRWVCTALQEVYKSSALLQYQFTLETTGYLDIPYKPCASTPSTSIIYQSGNNEEDLISPVEASGSSSLSVRSPFTNKIRPTIPSVQLASFPSSKPSTNTKNNHLPDSKIISAADKNNVLMEREKRWETLDWSEKRTFKVKGREGVYELQEGIFLMCDDFSEADDDKPSSIRLVPLPSTQAPDLEDPPIPTTLHKVDFPISDLTMDPSQDLIVVSEYRPESSHISKAPPTHRYHLLTLSTMKPHPLAKLPTLDFPPFTQAIMDTRQLLQIMGDTLVVQVSKFAPAWVLAGLGFGLGGLGGLGHEEEIVAWNWKTGKVLCRIALPENGWYSSFALLTPTSFLVTSTSNISPILPQETSTMGSIFPPVIQIYSFLPDPNNPIDPTQPLDTDPMDDTTPRPVLLCQLQLPLFENSVSVTAFDVRPDPPFPPNDHDIGDKFRKPFTQNSNKGIMVFELKVIGHGNQNVPDNLPRRERQKSYEIFILREFLIEQAEKGENRLKQAYENGGDLDGLGIRGVEKNLNWDNWGKDNTRFLDAVMKRRSWVCSCSGYRYVSLIPTIRSGGNRLWDNSSNGGNLHNHNNGNHINDELEDETNEIIPPPKKSDLMIFDFSPINVRKLLQKEQIQQQLEVERLLLSNPNEEDSSLHEDQEEEEENYHDIISKRLDLEFDTNVNNISFDEYLSKKSIITLVSKDHKTILPKRNIWKNDLITNLPFIQIRKEYGELANGVMCDDQRIIVVHTQGRLNGDWSTINQEMTTLCM
ncbi:uncharacterized protein L201_004411 [Kwoniella dendrophila CBS 6074]|uniref:F-box domain-containing protein n=1 Tax=Kwoniella dendrophila CBS 6074 TaxID=1295534 RepID=A0AAX4JXS8_9TREE